MPTKPAPVPEAERPPPSEQGFVLVTVLWIVGLLAVLTAGFALSVRTNVRVTANILEAAKAEALADAGVTLAVLDLMAARREGSPVHRFPVGGPAVTCAVADAGTLRIQVEDEAGKVDVNSAGTILLQALLIGLGEPPAKAARLADAIFDFRDADDERRPYGAEAADYRAAGLGWPPKNAPLQSIDELGQVYGMMPDLVIRLRPFIGIHSGLTGIDPSYAPPKLIETLRAGLSGSASAFGSFPELDASVALPAMFVAASARQHFAVHVEARNTSGAVFRRSAVLDMGQSRDLKPSFLSWERGRDGDARGATSTGPVPPC